MNEIVNLNSSITQNILFQSAIAIELIVGNGLTQSYSADSAIASLVQFNSKIDLEVA